MHVFVDAPNTTAAGPSAIVTRLLPALGRARPDCRFTAVLPDTEEYRALVLPENIHASYWHRARRGNDVARLRQLYWDLPRAIRAARPDVCLTLGDIPPLSLPFPQVILLHLALLVYAADELNGLHAWGAAKRRYLSWHFERAARGAARVIVQTPVMARRLARGYDIPDARIECIGQPAPAGHGGDAPLAHATGTAGGVVDLLFLAAYYPHKNHGILPALAAELRRRGLVGRVRIHVTLANDGTVPAAVHRSIAADSDLISNLGRLTSGHVAGAWEAAHALFLPTIVESYGLTYVEAMTAGRPVLTSDRDFARWMCSDLALYFDPCDPHAIADVIERFIALRAGAPPRAGEGAIVDERIFRDTARKLLARFPPDWDAAAHRFMEVTLAANSLADEST